MKVNGNNTHVRHEIEFELSTTGKIEFPFRRWSKEQDTRRVTTSNISSKTKIRIQFSWFLVHKLIFVPYFILVKKLSNEETIQKINEWLKK